MLLQMMVDRLALHDLEKWAVTSWAIWNARNKYYFERIQIHPKEILNGVLGFLHEYLKCMAAQRHDRDAEFPP